MSELRYCSWADHFQPSEEFYVDGEGKVTAGCKPCRRAYQVARNSSETVKETKRRQSRERHQRERRRLIEELGGVCACCGESEYWFLELDHVDGSGHLYRSLRPEGPKNRMPVSIKQLRSHMDQLQVLCANCHRSKTSLGYCVHVQVSELRGGSESLVGR